MNKEKYMKDLWIKYNKSKNINYLQFLIMKFTSLAVAALFLANSSAVLLQK